MELGRAGTSEGMGVPGSSNARGSRRAADGPCRVQKGKNWTELMVDLGKSRSMARDGREEKVTSGTHRTAWHLACNVYT